MLPFQAYVAVTNDLNQDQRMHRICNSLQSAGYQVTLIGRRKSNSKQLYDQSFSQHRLPMLFDKGVLFYIEYQIRLFFYLVFSNAPKLMYSVDLDTALPISLASKLRGARTIHDAHELFTEVPELLKSPLKRSLWNLVGKMTIKRFDVRITVNNSLATILSAKYNCNFISIRNLPTHKKKNRVQLDFDRPFIWYQGVLNEGRGLKEMIVAMSLLPELDLRIAGEGDKSLELRELAEHSDASNRIHFHGWMTSNEMYNWASNAWVGINLLDDQSGNYYHSLANRTFDYIQAELPALHMDFPEYRMIVEQYRVGELLVNLHINHIVDTIQRLRTDTKRFNDFRKECLNAKEALTWESESQKLVELLISLN